MKQINSNYDVKRVNNTINGNPRYVIHFLAFINDNDAKRAEELSDNTRPCKFPVDHEYDIAVSKSREIGGRQYMGKDFGGGIVFQSYNIDQDLNRIAEIKNK